MYKVVGLNEFDPSVLEASHENTVKLVKLTDKGRSSKTKREPEMSETGVPNLVRIVNQGYNDMGTKLRRSVLSSSVDAKLYYKNVFQVPASELSYLN